MIGEVTDGLLTNRVTNPGHSFRVLLVEDDAPTRTALRILLRQHGATVAATADGHEALRWLRTSRFDVLVTDRHMPRMSGDALLAACDAFSPHARPDRTVVISGDPDAGRVFAGRPGVSILAKPFDTAALLEMVTGVSS